MAQKRMFDIAIVDSDLFLEMPSSSQALYFHLGMRADDEGFINNIRKLMKILGSGEDDLKILISKKFIIPFSSGVLVIRHWKMNNYLNNTRIKNTICVEEKALLGLSENNEYLLLSDVCLTSVKPMLNQNRIEENRIEENRGEESAHAQLKNSLGDFLTVVKITNDELEKLITKYPEDVVMAALEKIENHCLSTNKRYPSYYHRALNWLADDAEKVANTSKQGRTEIIPEFKGFEPTEEEKAEYEKVLEEMGVTK